jgi:hypothetical protein
MSAVWTVARQIFTLETGPKLDLEVAQTLLVRALTPEETFFVVPHWNAEFDSIRHPNSSRKNRVLVVLTAGLSSRDDLSAVC